MHAWCMKPFKSNGMVQVAMLFRSHKDLLEEFTYFLPDAQAPAQASYLKSVGAADFVVNRTTDAVLTTHHPHCFRAGAVS